MPKNVTIVTPEMLAATGWIDDQLSMRSYNLAPGGKISIPLESKIKEYLLNPAIRQYVISHYSDERYTNVTITDDMLTMQSPIH